MRRIFRFERYFDRYHLKQWAVEQNRHLSVKADACSSCDQCVERCPYGVPIPRDLKTAHQRLTCQF